MRRKLLLASVLLAVLPSGAGDSARAAAAAGTNDTCVNNGVQGSPFAAGSGSVTVTGGQVSGAGATLFVDFFLSPTSTNDWTDVDGDGEAGFFTTFPFTDNLSTVWPPNGSVSTHWMFQYRSVGSVNGFNEFVENQTCSAIPLSIPSERGIFNQFSYASGGVTQWGGPFANASGTPVQPCEIEFAFLDVPSAWAVQVDSGGTCQPGGTLACATDRDCADNQKCAGAPKWNANPGSAGYGLNPITSSTGYISNLQPLSRECGTCANSGDACTAQKHCAPGNCSISVGIACRSDLNCPAGTCSVTPNACRSDAECPKGEPCLGAQTCLNVEACNLGGSVESLNVSFSTPDEGTIFDFVGAWVPVAYIANRGSGLENVKYSEMQYLFATGRMPNGENYVAATRSVGSGTRNAIMNSTGVDTSWARGDNVGNENAVTGNFNIGPNTQQTNAEGSSQVEQVVEMWRLGIGYTGLAGASRAVQDVRAGRYEILNVCKDVDENGDSLCDCTVQNCPAGPKQCAGNGAACNSNADCPPGQACVEIDGARPNDGYVRPTKSAVLDNCDACCGYQIGGNGSFVTRGDRLANLTPPGTANPSLDNQAVADYLNNISASIDAFVGDVFGNECNISKVCSVTTATSCQLDTDCPPGETCVPRVCTHDSQCTTKACSQTGLVCLIDPDCPPVPQTCLGGNCSIDAGFCVVDGDCSPVAQTCRADLCKSKLNSPGQFLANTFFLPAGIDCQQSLTDGMVFTPTASLNQALQNYIRANNDLQAGGDTPAFGSINPTTGGRVPVRRSLSGTGTTYSDGSITGTYTYWNGASFVTNLASGVQLSARNRLQGDMNEDGRRDINEASELVKAYYVPRNWQQTDPQAQGTGAVGGQTADNAIPEVIGDFNGDGNLSKEDLRYFADGLAIVNECFGGPNGGSACTTEADCPDGRCGRLDRKQGAMAIDAALAEWGRCTANFAIPCRADAECSARGFAGPCDLSEDYFPWADPAQQLLVAGAPGQDPTFIVPINVNDAVAPFLKTKATYQAGDFRGDVAGVNPTAGAQPLGWDGVVDEQDINYCCRSVRRGSWSDLNDAVYMDLSCDMNGDLDVDLSDVGELVGSILATAFGDLDLDGDVDSADTATMEASIAGNPCNNDGSCGWEDGDTNCDGYVTAVDRSALGPLGEPNPISKPRFFSFALPETMVASFGGQQTALRVRLTSLHHPANPPAGTPDFGAFEGEFRYVNSFSGNLTCPDSANFSTTYACARLGCEPEYRDWSADLAGAVLHVTGNAVAPSSSYGASVLQASCAGAETSCVNASSELTVTTGRWGDIIGPGNGPPDNTANVLDISAVVDKVKDTVLAFPEPRVWHKQRDPAPITDAVNVIDIGFVVDAVKNFPYPPAFTIQTCP